MKTNLKISVMLLLGNFAVAQQAFFLGTFREKGTCKNYWCLSAGDYVLEEVANLKQYNELREDFYNSHKNEWPYTDYLKAKRPFYYLQIQSLLKIRKLRVFF